MGKKLDQRVRRIKEQNNKCIESTTQPQMNSTINEQNTQQQPNNTAQRTTTHKDK